MELKKKIKVIHFLASPVIGGVEKLVLTLGANINKHRFDLILGIFVYNEATKNPLYNEAKAAGLQVEIIRINRHAYGLSQLADIYRIIAKHKPDIIHTHGYKTNLIGLAFAKFKGIRIVTTCHGWLTSENKKTNALNKLSTICLKFFDNVIAVSDEMKSILINCDVPISKIVLLRNMPAISRSSAHQEKENLRYVLNLPPKSKLIGFVGRLEKIKGCDQFVEAAALAARTLQQCHFIMVGDGSQKELLENRVKALGIGKYVHFLGYVEHTEHIFEDLDVYILPSRNEGLPLSLLEAMYFRIPIIASAVGGIPDVIRDGISGRLVPPNEPQKLALAIIEALQSYSKSENMALEAKRIVDEEFSIEKWVSRIENIYLEMVYRHQNNFKTVWGIIEK